MEAAGVHRGARFVGPSVRLPRLVVVLALAAVVAAALVWRDSSSAQAPMPVARVSGAVGVVGGPLVLATGGPAIPVNHPEWLPGRTVLISGRTSRGVSITRRVVSDSNGRFALPLPAGAYTVTALVIGNAPLEAQPSSRVTVRSGSAVRVRVLFDAP